MVGVVAVVVAGVAAVAAEVVLEVAGAPAVAGPSLGHHRQAVVGLGAGSGLGLEPVVPVHGPGLGRGQPGQLLGRELGPGSADLGRELGPGSADLATQQPADAV